MLDCHEDRPMGCDENKVFNITTNGSLAEIRIPQLRKFTSYVLSVQVFNSKGRGNFSKTINITTDEDSKLHDYYSKKSFLFCNFVRCQTTFSRNCVKYSIRSMENTAVRVQRFYEIV